MRIQLSMQLSSRYIESKSEIDKKNISNCIEKHLNFIALSIAKLT